MIAAVCFLSIALVGCDKANDNSDGNGDTVVSVASSSGASNGPSQSGGSDKRQEWDGSKVSYSAADIAKFGSGTPYGYAKYDKDADAAIIWNTDVSLDNYGGVQTPMLLLDFSKAVTFKMHVVSCYSKYIVKLAVEGENEYYYVLSDDGRTGDISVNVVDSMLSDKYRSRNTQPDPGYRNGWKYDGQKKNCSFHILAKGPDGEQQTAELIVSGISVFNDEIAVKSIKIAADGLVDGVIKADKGTEKVLAASFAPSSVTDGSVIWESLDESVATVSADGSLKFVGVGKTRVTATSAADQSKSDSIEVSVLSGYEDVSVLKKTLSSLALDGSVGEGAVFKDIFRTSWADETEMTQAVYLAGSTSAKMRSSGFDNYVYDYFDGNAAAKAEADRLAAGDRSYLTLSLPDANGATVYRLIGDELTKETCNGSIKTEYLEKKNGEWKRVASYDGLYVIVGKDGSVKKTKISVVSCDKLGDFSAADYLDETLWTIPDRTRQSEDRVVHALSPASVSVENGVAVLKQNKYPEAKYCFGGIVGNVLSAGDRETEIVIDVRDLNKMNDYVKTMWEIKILYYKAGASGYEIISSNPIKLSYGNEAGVYNFTFKPAYEYFRLYLVVNGSEIGAQFPDAQIKIAGMQIYSLDKN